MKNGLNRMIMLGEMLKQHNIPYEWNVFTNSETTSDYFTIKKPKLDIINDIANADYLVQLSDSEGYCYSIVEALLLKVPVICTNMKVIDEIGVNRNNSYILDMDMTNVDVEKIYNEIPKVENYKQKDCNLISYINKTKSKYREEKKMKYKVEALDTYERLEINDAGLNKIPKAGEQFEVNHERLEVLLGDNPYNEAFIKVVEEIKEEIVNSDGEVKGTKKTTSKKTTKKKE